MLFLFLYSGLRNYPQTYQDGCLVSILMEDGLSVFCAYLVSILHLECTINSMYYMYIYENILKIFPTYKEKNVTMNCL